ncbi:MAG: hypothetical protein L6W00_21605 [Lentisphaeria bacterium]|nr:MAG: hypothetical protein L6W00_21605 [Lentisphaeria bacterium]
MSAETGEPKGRRGEKEGDPECRQQERRPGRVELPSAEQAENSRQRESGKHESGDDSGGCGEKAVIFRQPVCREQRASEQPQPVRENVLRVFRRSEQQRRKRNQHAAGEEPQPLAASGTAQQLRQNQCSAKQQERKPESGAVRHPAEVPDGR